MARAGMGFAETVAQAVQDAFEDQRRDDVCAMNGEDRAFVDFYGPLTRACQAELHGRCDGHWQVLNLYGTCLCPCHAGGTR